MKDNSARSESNRHAKSARPYRSKRHPPCDQCRRKKLRCEAQGNKSCQRCEASASQCSFDLTLPGRSTLPELRPSPAEQDDSILPESTGIYDESHQITTPAPTGIPEIEPEIQSGLNATSVDEFFLPSQPEYHIPERPTPQAIQTLDQLKGFSSQVIGASGESDPWLLRHCKFDDHGFLLFHQVHFRNAGGVPLEEKIPVHFLVSADHLYEQRKEETRFPKRDRAREELNTLVPLECGQRLVSLFLKFIFPDLPIISRSQYGLSSSQTVPEISVLQNIPVHLLAAIYASAQPFAKFDEYLCVIHAYSAPSTDELWRLVFELLFEELHTPHLATLQAGLLYLHKPSEGKKSSVADSSFVWSFVGMLVGLATSLGLTLECKPMGLPAWERRLRRRLWWAVYAEDKWRSLMMGRPPYIRHDEWDVTDLDDDDFQVDQMQIDFLLSPDEGLLRDGLHMKHFQYFARLSRIADEVQVRLFSLRASQRLSSNFDASLDVARGLLQSLKEWYSLLPSQLRLQNRLFATIDRSGPRSHCLHFSYLLLEVFIFRSLLRPMVRSAAPPRLFEETEDPTTFTNVVDDYITQIIEASEVEPVPAIDMSEEHGAGNAVLKAAENCAATVLRSVMRMSCSDLAGFWYSWSRIGFATVSSFMMLLIVQAPSKEHALRARRLVYMWRQALRGQSQGCELLNLALVRLDGPHWAGLARNFFLPKHVKEALDCTIDQS
ncbi:uncharacterized protein N7469_010484 [Penicillium citrinum]|uniref:Zn(2)-C6 fungal-type domain-containing protein n=1 Tax=Penicillium citrinum TaxID=5077 RepID=A0A9W9TG48_PENCI|nr:uncharacterized protein N7469_010484 [Penicillium citrinum]KAJ5221597.1 hypothetical protein N7469_010484 [Penicillium citrinum]